MAMHLTNNHKFKNDSQIHFFKLKKMLCYSKCVLELVRKNQEFWKCCESKNIQRNIKIVHGFKKNHGLRKVDEF